MKIFSNKNRTRLFTLLLGGVMCASTASGVALLDGTVVGSADVPTDVANATVKIEDLIETTADFNVIEAHNNGWKSGADATFDWNGGMVMWGQNNMAVRTTSVAGDGNVIDYDGNLAVWTDDSESTHGDGKWTGVGFQIAKETPYAKTLGEEGYGIINFRTRYDAQWLKAALGIMVAPKTAGVFNDNNGRGGYSFHISGGEISLNEDKLTGNIWTPIKTVTLNDTLVDNDIWDVTYGVVKDDDTNVIYLNIDKWNETTGSWTNVANFTHTDTNLADNEWNANGKAFSFVYSKQTYQADNNDCGVLLAGVDEPINAKGAWTETATEGTKLSEISLSRNGYTAVNADETVDIGTKDYAVTKTVDYYGNSVETTAYVTLTGERTLTAEQLAAATTNVEDMIQGTGDFAVVTKMNSSVWASEFDWSGAKNDFSGQYVHGVYTGATENEFLDYDGNIAIWVDKTEYAKALWGCAGYIIKPNTQYAIENGGGYGLIRLRMNYLTSFGPLTLNMLAPKAGNNSYLQHDGLAAGYGFVVNTDGTIKLNEKRVSSLDKVGDVQISNSVQNGDILDVTYGAIKYSESINALYLRIQRWTGNAWQAVCEYTYFDTDLTDNQFPSDRQNSSFSIVTCEEWQPTETDKLYVLLAGVDEPILAVDKNLSGYEADEADGTLESIELPANYAWKNAETVLEIGEQEYDATYSYTYYGEEKTVDVKVAVAVTGVRATVTLKDGDDVIYTANVKLGESFAFNTATLTGVDTVIGWTAANSEELLRPDYTFTATENGTFVYNVVDIDFKMYAGASIRTAVDANGNGGIRFVAMFESNDWAALAEYITGAYGVIVPVDDTTYFNGGFTAAAKALYTVEANNFVGKTAMSYADLYLTEQQAGGYALYSFAMTDVKYKNYNREFAAMSFITVEYADGSTATFETAYNEDDNCRSVYEVALAAIAAHKAADNALYSNKQLAVLESYIANVVDVEVGGASPTEATYTVVDREGHGFARPYTLVSGEFNQTSGQLIIVLSVAEDSLLATNATAPVYITRAGQTVRFEATVVYADGQATLTAQIAPVQQ